jgi:hypothetical protein
MTNLPKSAGKTFCSQLWYAVKQTTKKSLENHWDQLATVF